MEIRFNNKLDDRKAFFSFVNFRNLQGLCNVPRSGEDDDNKGDND